MCSACGAPGIAFFRAEPAQVAPGEMTQLSWSSSGSGACRLEPAGAEVGLAGAQQVSPETSTEFTLRCGTAVATVLVEVKERISAFSVTPGTIEAGDSATLSWQAAARGCRLDPPGDAVEASATKPVRPASTTTFTLSCGAASTSTILTVRPARGDPFFAQQWHLLNTGQNGGTPGEDLSVQATWAEGVGEGVRVAVVDDGVDLGHEDLRANANVAASHDYLGNATVDLAQHGTAVAGLIGARDNNGVGGRGVAPRSSLVSYNFLQDSSSANELDAMVRGLDTNLVSSNSWGDADDGTGQLTFAEALWLMGVRRGVAEGRGGRGLVYVFPSGNGANLRHRDDSNFDGQANSRFVIAVGGVSDDGRRAAYSEAGANVLVSAPSGSRGNHTLFTTDITGAPGYSSGRTPGEPSNPNYTSTFDGTSAAVPLVSGTVALVLEANPALTWRDVRRVLALSARRNDPSHPDWTMNGAGRPVNHDYGFGVVDVTAAVRLARSYQAGAPEVTWRSPSTPVGLAIPDGAMTGVQTSLTVTGSGVRQVDTVEVTVTITHPNSGELDLRLRHGNSVSRLHPVHTCAPCTAIDAFTFTSVRHLDEPGDGSWTLEARDAASPNVGRVVSWTLALFGRP